MSDFKSKYHKYKLKYLQLGGDDTDSEPGSEEVASEDVASEDIASEEVASEDDARLVDDRSENQGDESSSESGIIIEQNGINFSCFQSNANF